MILSRVQLMALVDASIVLSAFLLGLLASSEPTALAHAASLGAAAAGLAWMLLVVIGGYNLESRFGRKFLVVGALVALAAMAALFLLGASIGTHPDDLTRIEATLGVAVFGMMAMRYGLCRVGRAAAPRRCVVVAAPAATLRRFLPLIEQAPMTLAEAFPVEPGGATLDPQAVARLLVAAQSAGVTDLLVPGELRADPALAPALARVRSRGVRLATVAQFLAAEFGRLPQDDAAIADDIARRFAARGATGRVAKRAVDIVLALALLALFAPLMALIAAAVRLDDGGPAFYSQVRVGLGDRAFTLFKFRSMRTDAEADGRAQWAARCDDRITRVGGLLRVSRLDELPQLLNVLRGDMSIVGPRPERPELVVQLRRHIPLYDLRHRVRPGITGWAQINYPYGASVEDAVEKTQYDLYYVHSGGLLLDLRIILETIRVVALAEGGR